MPGGLVGLNFSHRQLERDYNRVRDELREVGLLVDGHYLDDIECYTHIAPLGFIGRECARVYDEAVNLLAGAVGFRPGHIYVFTAAPLNAYVPGETLVDVIRHEFAHSWAWRDRPFFRRPWFRRAFGADYDADPWDEPDDFDSDDYVSEYATGQAKEDFAETFMVFLRDRRSLSKHRRCPGLFAKLQAVEAAVAQAAMNRVYTARRPRGT